MGLVFQYCILRKHSCQLADELGSHTSYHPKVWSLHTLQQQSEPHAHHTLACSPYPRLTYSPIFRFFQLCSWLCGTQGSRRTIRTPRTRKELMVSPLVGEECGKHFLFLYLPCPLNKAALSFIVHCVLAAALHYPIHIHWHKLTRPAVLIKQLYPPMILWYQPPSKRFLGVKRARSFFHAELYEAFLSSDGCSNVNL